MASLPEVIRARWAVAAVFLINGMQIGSWAPQVPIVKARLGLSEVDLGLALLVIAIGAAVSMPFSGLLIARWGSAPVTRLTILLQILAFPVVALAPNHATLLVGSLMFGAGTGLSDVGMNAHAVEVERRLARPIMSNLHGLFSVGAFIAASGGGLLLTIGSPELHVGVVVVVSLAIAAMILPGLLPGGIDRAAPGTTFALPTRAVALIGALTFIAFMTEGAIVDWSAVYLGDELGATPGTAAAGYAAFAAGMAIGRLSGDLVRARASAVMLLRVGALASALMMAIGVISATPPILIFGLAISGLGLANAVPILFTAAGRTPGQPPAIGVAAVASTGYFGLLAGPPLIGFVAEGASLGAAFLILAAAVFLIAVTARAARPADMPGEA